MDDTDSIFQSFWKLILSQLTDVNDASLDNEKLLKDMFSSTFGKAFETASACDKELFIETLKSKTELLARNPVDASCLEILVAWLNGQPTDPSSESVFLDSLFNENPEAVFRAFESPLVARVLAGMDSLMRDHFVVEVERKLLPLIKTDEEKIQLLNCCPALAGEIETFMTRTITEILEFLSTPPPRVSSQLELTLTVVASSPRILLFKQLPNIATLKEQFMVTLAVGIRHAAALGVPVENLKKMFFLLPNVGVVMDRWLDKELARYNKDVSARVKQFLQATGAKGSDQMRDALVSAFPKSDEEYIVVPFAVEGKISSFIQQHANDDEKFKLLPCALSAECAGSVLKLFPTWFESSGDRARLTPAALAQISGKEKKPFSSSLEARSAPTASVPEDLIDILLKEILNKLPEHAFLTRPYPSKVQTGVYRFGTREVTFHAKGGTLYVFRVGGYVSEAEASDFIAREFGVKAFSTEPSAANSRRMTAPLPPPSSRKPMEWDNEEFLNRLVKRGLKANDLLWREAWEAHTRADAAPDKDSVAKFIERNLAYATKQSWARDLLYHGERRRDSDNFSSGLDSDDAGNSSSKPRDLMGVFKPPGDAHPNYKTRLCVNFPMGRCTRGAACAYAHGETDLRSTGTVVSANSQTQFYKTRICNAFMEGRCTRGAGCSYAHSEAERLEHAGGVVKRDAKAGQDIRLEEKRKALAKSQGRSRSRSRSKSRRDKPTSHSLSKPLPYLPGRRVDDTEL